MLQMAKVKHHSLIALFACMCVCVYVYLCAHILKTIFLKTRLRWRFSKKRRLWLSDGRKETRHLYSEQNSIYCKKFMIQCENFRDNSNRSAFCVWIFHVWWKVHFSMVNYFVISPMVREFHYLHVDVFPDYYLIASCEVRSFQCYNSVLQMAKKDEAMHLLQNHNDMFAGICNFWYILAEVLLQQPLRVVFLQNIVLPKWNCIPFS